MTNTVYKVTKPSEIDSLSNLNLMSRSQGLNAKERTYIVEVNVHIIIIIFTLCTLWKHNNIFDCIY